MKVRKKAKIRNWYNQASLLTQDAKKSQYNITHKRAKRSALSKVTKNRQENMTNTNHKQQKWSTKEVSPWNGHQTYTITKTASISICQWYKAKKDINISTRYVGFNTEMGQTIVFQLRSANNVGISLISLHHIEYDVKISKIYPHNCLMLCLNK